jgi:hypothetical protein
MRVLFGFIFCISSVGFALYSYINVQNELTELRIKAPQLTRKLQAIKEENTRLQFIIEKFENPLNLMELSRKPQYGHLKHPLVSDIIYVELPLPKDLQGPYETRKK